MAEKLFYSMGEVAEMFDVNASLIRHWESQFSVIRPNRNKKGNRLFSPQDVENLKLIYHLVKERGMTLEGAKKALKQKPAAEGGVQRDAELIDKAQQLDIKNRYRQQLSLTLKDSQQNSNAHVIFEIEKQTLAKADALFAVLKRHKWQKKNNTFMFYDDKAVQEFNALYKEMLHLNKQTERVATANQKAVENKL